MEIRIANEDDVDLLSTYDRHINVAELSNIVKLGRVYIAEDNGTFVGWLRYNLFWDNTPFMNMLFFMDNERGKGYGRQFVDRWENDMKRQGYNLVMTSTQSNEYAQHFYMKLGYQVKGGFLLDGESYEVILSKSI